MKKLLLIQFFILFSFECFAFGGGHDSLLFDGEVYYEMPKTADCYLKITTFNKVVIKTHKLVKSTACGEEFTERITVEHTVNKEVNVPLGSDITTGPEGFAVVELWDESKLFIGPNSTVKIDEEFCDNYGFKLLGSCLTWIKIKKFFGGKGYEVATDRAIVGVRGTEFEVIEDADKTTVKVYEGTVEVTPKMTDKTNKELIRAYEKLIEDMQTGKITEEEYIEKTTKMTEIMEGSRKFPSVMVEAGKMVEVTYEVSEVKEIPADNDKWFEDPKFNK